VDMTHKAVLLDTSFFLRFLNESDPLFNNADDYFRYFIQKEITMMISTISIAEYCVGGDVHELPLKNLQIVPFNLDHSKRTGEFAKIAFEAKRKGIIEVTNRNIIPNDTKLFAQADREISIEFYLSSDIESQKIYKILRQKSSPRFQFINLNTPTMKLSDFLTYDKSRRTTDNKALVSCWWTKFQQIDKLGFTSTTTNAQPLSFIETRPSNKMKL